MSMKRSSAPVAIEAVLFAGMVGAIAIVALMVLGGFDLLPAAGVGIILAAVVFVVVILLMGQGALPGPRGPGNADMSDQSSASTPTPGTAPAAAPAVAEAPEASAVPGTKPEFLTAARDSGPDDLKKIKGVGPKLEMLLHSMGVYHFDQVAAWTADEVAWVDDNLEGFKGRVSRDEWVAQAKALAGDRA